MTKRRMMPAAAATLAAMALLAAGCSSASDHAANTAPKQAVHHDDGDANADPDSGGLAPDVPGGDDDEEVAGLTPGTSHGTKITSYTVKGYHATFNPLALPSTPD